MNLSKLTLKYADQLSGRHFEWYCALLFILTGHYGDTHIKNVYLTKASNDHGLDITMETDEDNIKPSIKIGVQVKHRSSLKEKVGYRSLEEVSGGMAYYHFPGVELNSSIRFWGNSAVVMTNGYFSEEAKKSAERMGVQLINRNALEELIAEVRRTVDNNELEALTKAMGYRDGTIACQKVLDIGIPKLLNSKKGSRKIFHNNLNKYLYLL